jgi:hypothetical protein
MSDKANPDERMTRDQLVRETFEMSREIGYRNFLDENFNRPDPALIRLNPDERRAFLREWWDAARDRMFESYRAQVSGYGVDELIEMRKGYITAIETLPPSRHRADVQRAFHGILSGDNLGDDRSAELSSAPIKTRKM